MLAYYLEWHLRGALAEFLFDDHEREAAEETRASIVAPAPRSAAAWHKEQARRTADGHPVQRFQCRPKALATPCYYLSRSAAETAVRRRQQFNIIHPSSGLKIDVIVASDSPFDRNRFARGRRLPGGADFEVTFGSPEDVIIKKMEDYREGGSDKHLRDITGVLKVQGDRLDRQYVAQWATRLGLQEIWAAILQKASGRGSESPGADDPQ